MRPFGVTASRDAQAAYEVERAMGWTRTLAEVERRFGVAEGFLARDAQGEGIGSATLAVYRGADADAPAFAWVGGMAVLPAWRGRGVARALLQSCLDLADARGVPVVALDATDMGRPLYERHGFRAVGRTPRWRRVEGEPAPRPSARHSVHPISISEAMEIAEYDAARFGAKRLPYLMALLHAFPWRAFMARDRRTGDVSGFAFGAERAVGPWMADDEECAAALLAACELSGAAPALVATDRNPLAAPLLQSLGYASEGACTRMVRGGALPMRDSAVFGIATYALG